VLLSRRGAAAGVLRWAVLDRDRRVEPIWDAQRSLLFVGDVRLYNRSALRHALAIEAPADATSDAEIAWKAYLRWGDDSPRHLIGDFAFVVWDGRQRSIFAARDHFGVRPLYYIADGRRVYVASDVRQLLAVTPDPLAQIDPQTILQRFSMSRRTQGLTYFRNIASLPAGHGITIDGRGRRLRRYWVPSFTSKREHTRDDAAEIRELFQQAVRDRLESVYPIVAHSSGGFDSSAIVMAADQIYREGADRPSLVMASALTPGMPSDDSRYMDAVAARVCFEGVRWNALAPNLADIEAPVIAHPGQRRGTGGGPRRDLQVARERNARVLLHGFFGDALLQPFGAQRDMLRGLRWNALARHVLTGDGLRARIRLLGRAMTGVLSPAPALRLLNRLENRSFKRAPEWMGPELLSIYPPPPGQLVLPEVDWPSHLACELWADMTSPRMGVSVDGVVAYGSDEGIEVRLPYLDVRLAEKILSIPSEARWPQDGDNRRLSRDALGPLLPDEFAHRRTRGSWMPVWHLAARRMLPLVEELMSGATWLSAPYINRAKARSLLADALARGEGAPYREMLVVTGFGAIEAWLREVFRYHTARKESVCLRSP
jgi:asparagine synthase (glutamine-hydrolysing)